MKIGVSEEFNFVLSEVFNPIKITTSSGQYLSVCERDGQIEAISNSPIDIKLGKAICESCRDNDDCWVERLHIMKETTPCPHYVKR